ncbi:MAG: 3,4-dihydroxy-2-butanone-4-phosphate synthase, partial [Candidatus Omnitrophica bacterium]|nr:3,4-dihydroxy-2-butanone-4-phosphate synthase [Candidatus Omnitrophota bacterium]
MITPIKHILSEIEAGRPVIVVDDEDRENEGDIVVAAQFATPEIINFMITQGRGLVCVPMDSSRIELLGLEPMRYENDDPFKTAWMPEIGRRAFRFCFISSSEES